MLKALDSDQNKVVSIGEFTTGAKQFLISADKDKNGNLTLDELNDAIESLYSKTDIMAPSFVLARSVMRLGDINRDEKIAESEWNEVAAKQFGLWDKNKSDSLDEAELVDGLNGLMSSGFPQFIESGNPQSSGEKPPIKN